MNPLVSVAWAIKEIKNLNERPHLFGTGHGENSKRSSVLAKRASERGKR